MTARGFDRAEQAQRAFTDAGITALLAFGLFLPLIGFKTVIDIRNELILTTRWPLLFAIVGIVGFGRLFYSLTLEPWLKRRALRPAPVAQPAWRVFAAKWFIPFAIGFVIVYPVIVVAITGFGGAVKWIDNFGIQILIYVMLGWGLNIVVGLAGLLDLGYVAFYAVGAYSYALLAKEFGFSFWILLPLAGVLSSFWGILLGFPVLRLRGDYLAIVTLAFGEIIRIVIINWVDLTNGYAGISGIPRPTFFGIPFNANEDGFAARFGLEFSPIYRTIFLYYVILALAFLTAFVTMRLRRLPVGRAWEALARRRDRLPLARHQHHQHQAHRLRHGRDVCRLCRFVLRRAARLHFAGILHLPGIGHHPVDRRARRHGQPDWRRHRRHRDDRRHRDHARTRFPQADLRRRPSIRRSTACCCSVSPWC